MPVYVVAQMTFTDEARYRRYQKRFADVFQRSGGRLLTADESPILLEGDWVGDKLVIMSFESEKTALSFLESPEYEDISQDRRGGANTVALLARGLEHSGTFST